MTKLETLAMSRLYSLSVYDPWRTLLCKGFSVFRSCAVFWNGVLCRGWRKSLSKCPISQGL
ncbi:MAG: hypothetical protein ACKO3K_17180, partial [Cuspidothrix sp.]